MIGRLSRAQMTKVLRDNSIGRIGMSVDGRTYVVPVTYAHDGDSVYGHAVLGLKIRMMRKNPSVCFEVDEIEDMGNWRSVIAQGTYEELSGDLAVAAAKLIQARLARLATSETAGPSGRTGKSHVSYRLRLRELSGRYERTPRRRRAR